MPQGPNRRGLCVCVWWGGGAGGQGGGRGCEGGEAVTLALLSWSLSSTKGWRTFCEAMPLDCLEAGAWENGKTRVGEGKKKNLWEFSNSVWALGVSLPIPCQASSGSFLVCIIIFTSGFHVALSIALGKKHPFEGECTVLDKWLTDQTHPVAFSNYRIQNLCPFPGSLLLKKKKKARSLSCFPCIILVNALQQI